jgi:O-antigen ligase
LREVGDPASLVTTLLVAIILVSGPLVLGAARLWFELPLLAGVSLLMLLQGLRLTRPLTMGRIRQADAIDLSVVLFVLYTVVRWLTSPSEYFSRIEAMDVVAYAAIFFTCRYGITPRRYGLALLYGLVGLGVFETVFGYYLSHNLDWCPFGASETLHQYYFPRWVGTYGCPNHYGSLLVMATGAALALGSFSKLPWPLRIVFFYLAGAMMVGVMFSISRGSYLALAASVLALTIFGLRHGTVRWWVPVTATVVLLVSAVFLFSQSRDVRERTNEVTTTFERGQLSTYIRYELARDALHIASDHPVFGTGPGTFVFIHPRYQDSTFTRKAVLAHDDYLNCVDDYGVVGFGIAMFFLFAVTLSFLGPLWADHRWQDRVMVAAGFAACAAYIVHSFLDFNLHIPANALMFFALVGLGLGRLHRDDAVRPWSTLSLAPLGGYLGWAVMLFGLLYGVQATRTAVGDILYEQPFAQALEVPVAESLQDAQQALVYDRDNVQDLVFIGDLYRYQASRKANMEDQIAEAQKAMDYYQQAIKVNPLDDTIRAKMGMTFDLMGRSSEAFFCYKEAVTRQPYNGQFWFWLGNHYWQRGMLDKAKEAYLQAKNCPHGMEGSEEAIKELQALPGGQSVPLPSEDANPVAPTSDEGINPAAPPSDARTNSGTPVFNPEDHPPTVP